MRCGLGGDDGLRFAGSTGGDRAALREGAGRLRRGVGVQIRAKVSAGAGRGSYLFAWVFNALADIRYDSQLGSFRLISRKVVDYVVSMRERLRLVMGLIDWMGFPTAVVEVQHDARADGVSSYSFRKRLQLATDVIIAYSDKPLRLSVQFGFLIASLALLGGGVVFVRALFFGSEVLGWASLMVALFLLGGIIICNLGVVGIYLGKVYDEVKVRPLYVVRDVTPSLPGGRLPRVSRGAFGSAD